MKPSKLIIETAIEQASLSLHRFRVGAVIYYKNSIQGEGFNQANKTHTKSPHPYKMIDAEFAAVIDACRGVSGYYGYTPDLLKDCSIYVHRLKRDNTPGLAKPCEYCSWMLDNVGIKKDNIYFSDDETRL